MIRAFAPLLLASLVLACAPPEVTPPPAAPHAASATVTWAPLRIAEAGGANDEVIVRGGEVVRLETQSDAPVSIGERLRSGTGSVEAWSTLTPVSRVITLRPALFTTAILFARGSVGRAHVAHGFEPGYAWFALEDRVLAWARGPLPAPFPPIASPHRIDVAQIAAVDHVLEQAVAGASDRDAALEEARAVRAVVGLRATRVLRPVNGFPYFFDDDVAAPGATRSQDDAASYAVTAAKPLEVTVDGPQLLHVWSRAARSEDDGIARVRILEGTRERAVSGATVPHVQRNTTTDPAPPDGEPPASSAPRAEEPAERVALRRATVHVPPGAHRYRIEIAGGDASVHLLTAREVVHLEDAAAGSKSETRQLARARHACAGGSPALCLVTLALLGEDDPTSAAWASASAAAPAPAREAAAALARGGPRDPSVALEIAASQGDTEALATLADAAARETDDGLRDAWMRAVTRGTHWVASEEEPATTWAALLFDEGASAKCGAGEGAPWTEVTAKEADFATSTWRGLHAFELLAALPCDAKEPVQMSIDGEAVTASPSASPSRWHVLVQGATARARRIDAGGGHVYALPAAASACGAHWESVGAPRVVASQPTLAFAPAGRAPGLDVWLRDGAKSGAFDVTSAKGSLKMRVVASPHAGIWALDDKGARWLRAARIPLPAWASEGVRVNGGNDVAVRAVVRAPRSGSDAPRPATPVDEAQLVELTRAILRSPVDARGDAYSRRATALASSGYAHAALEDARAAQALGVADALAQTRAAMRSRGATPLALPPGTKAYGLEPDFDPGAPRCAVAKATPRARLVAVEEALHAARSPHWDAALSVRAAQATRANPGDPRGDAILARALSGSRWQRTRRITGGSRVQRPRDTTHEGAVGPDGELRARIATGSPFGRDNHVTVSGGKPARAVLSGVAGASARVDFVCVPLAPAEALRARCPIEITVGDLPPILAESGADGRGHVERFPALAARGAQTRVSFLVRGSPARWTAILRIVFDREVPGSVREEGTGWVLETPDSAPRVLVKTRETISTVLATAGLVRVDAIAEPGDHPRVLATVDGRDEPIPIDGTPVTIAVPNGGTVAVRTEGGAATIALAERVPKGPSANLPEDDVEDEEHEPSRAAPIALDPDATSAGASQAWRAVVDKSARPLTPLEENLGTFVSGTVGVAGTLREGAGDSRDLDANITQILAYRRRIERISLWTTIDGFARAREGAPTLGGSATLYEDYDPAHLRFSVTTDVASQRIEGAQVTAVKPRGFLEYSWRATRAFFILPRIGYDGWYTSSAARPASLKNIDDDVVNPFRDKRKSLAFGQLLFWLVPYFNDIFYVRGRVTVDAGAGELSHVAGRPGIFLAFGQLDVNAYVDAAYYQATRAERAASLDVTGGLGLMYNAWAVPGSLDIQPGVSAFARADGGYSLALILNVLASNRRGLRDFSSLELDFPEQLGGNVPWRGAPMGVPR